MKLTFINEPGCYQMFDLIKSIFAVSQLEQEFYPYLNLEYLSNTDGKPARVIISCKEDIITIPTRFETNPNDLDKVRKVIWKLLYKHYNINTYDGSDQIPPQTNKVTQRFKNAVSNRPKCYLHNNDNNKSHSDILYNILNTPKISNNYNINETNCASVLKSQCSDNYKKNTYSYDRCVDDINKVCNCVANKATKNGENKGYLYFKELYPQTKISRKTFNDIVFNNLYRNEDKCDFNKNKLDVVEGFSYDSNSMYDKGYGYYILMTLFILIVVIIWISYSTE